MEGRGYDASGKVTFNAFGTLYDVGGKRYTLHSYARGMVGDFAFTPNNWATCGNSARADDDSLHRGHRSREVA